MNTFFISIDILFQINVWYSLYSSTKPPPMEFQNFYTFPKIFDFKLVYKTGPLKINMMSKLIND